MYRLSDVNIVVVTQQGGRFNCMFACHSTLVCVHRREVDLLLGNWAQEEVPKLDADELADFEYLLELETTEIHDVILGSVEPPPVCSNV